MRPLANPIGATGASTLLKLYHDSKNANFDRFAISPEHENTVFEQIDGIPVEISQLSFNEIFSYLKTIKNGGVKVYRSKIQLLGHQSTGKTSLMNCLFPLSGSFIRHKPGSCCSQSSEEPIEIQLLGPVLNVKGQHAEFSSFRIYLSKGSYSCTFPSEQTILLTCNSKALQKTKPMHLEFAAPGLTDYDSAIDRINAAEIKDAVPSSIEFSFSEVGDKKSFNYWKEGFIHWTIEASSRGVSTKSISVPLRVKGEVVTADIRVMDFAGQEEFVDILSL